MIGGLRQLGDDLPTEQGLVHRAVRVLVGHAGPLGGGPGRSRPRRHVTGRQIARQFAALDRPGSAADPRSRSQSSRRNPRGRAGEAGVVRGGVRRAGPQAVRDARRPGGPGGESDRSGSANCRAARRSSRPEIKLLEAVAEVMNEADGHPGSARNRFPGHRGGDGSDRAAAAIAPDQSRAAVAAEGRRRAAAAAGRPWIPPWPCSASA